MNQWYNRSWREQYRERTLVTKVHSWGYAKTVGPEPVQDIVRTAIRKAMIWGYPLLINDLDIEQAFDYMNHIALDDGNESRGASINVRLAALRDYTGKKAKARLNGVGVTEEFRQGSGGRQGGVRTPDEWKNLLKKELAILAQD